MSSSGGYTTRVAAIAFVVVAAAVLWLFPPLDAGFYPRCIFLSLSGWECAGCGSQRALHELVHLRIASAFGYNPLLVVSIPYLVLGFVTELRYRRSGGTKSRWLRERLYGQCAIWVVLTVIVVFTIARNLL